METLSLIRHPSNEYVADLIPGKKVKIFSEWIASALALQGITVTPQFRKQYGSNWVVYPTDKPSLFALAFEHCYFVHGLQQMGCHWVKKDMVLHNLSNKEIIDIIFADDKQSTDNLTVGS